MAKRTDVSLDVLLSYLDSGDLPEKVKVGETEVRSSDINTDSLLSDETGLLHMSALTAMYKASQSSGTDSDSVCRHFLLARQPDGTFEVLREEVSGNSKSTEKDAVRKRLALRARMEHGIEDARVVSISETSAGASLWGASSAEEILETFGVQGL